ncbi:DEKNAAC101080 [Brettanomyces naardenensis]|uniref:DEKNAAC101080 n=1 Tax=Brettanomyces naardenensis TaxID=13370 RepID=A0A448YHI0_BRENA|nr:DEKNAAC101080 [Brettanomyces naardenensis]
MELSTFVDGAHSSKDAKEATAATEAPPTEGHQHIVSKSPSASPLTTAETSTKLYPSKLPRESSSSSTSSTPVQPSPTQSLSAQSSPHESSHHESTPRQVSPVQPSPTQSSSSPISPTSSSDSRSETHKKRAFSRRSRTGCLTCRRRRIKCDEGRPFCHNCLKSHKLCSGYAHVEEMLRKKRKLHASESLSITPRTYDTSHTTLPMIPRLSIQLPPHLPTAATAATAITTPQDWAYTPPARNLSLPMLSQQSFLQPPPRILTSADYIPARRMSQPLIQPQPQQQQIQQPPPPPPQAPQPVPFFSWQYLPPSPIGQQQPYPQPYSPSYQSWNWQQQQPRQLQQQPRQQHPQLQPTTSSSQLQPQLLQAPPLLGAYFYEPIRRS